ncbi:SMI1/KNR4 family protein [Streptomyces sp. NPDC085995]|uniref:SMI1/KNR4 family protein n=1 Tax=Streptomyces sp. NPDC085995 TaxID=3154861 RepID=UPI0034142F01
MEFEEFEAILSAARTERAGQSLPEGFQLFDSWVASDADLSHAEQTLRARLPEKYKEFMRRHGAGQFLFLDLLPVVSVDEQQDDLLSVNEEEFRGGEFVAVAPVGTGDWWGFRVVDGVCLDRVDFVDHEDGSVSSAYSDFLEFLARRGLRAD